MATKQMATKQIACFSDVFAFAETAHGIDWNTANDVFFNNAFEYQQMSEAVLGLHALSYISDADIKRAGVQDYEARLLVAEQAGKITGLFTKEEVANMTSAAKSYIITAEYLESINATGSVLVESY